MELTKYKNFWLIWLSCAGSSTGTSLFRIQKNWGIESNYLYHNERGLGTPLFRAMMKEGYLQKKKAKLLAGFGWVADYVIRSHKPGPQGVWDPNMYIIQKWPQIQLFLEKNHEFIFSPDRIKLLYKNIENVRKTAQYIFDDIYLFVFVYNIIPLAVKYEADIVARILNTLVSLLPHRNLLDYYKSLQPLAKSPEFPKIVQNEKELMDILSPV